MAYNRRTVLLSFCAIALPHHAHSQEGVKDSGDPLSVEITSVALPVTSNGVLTNYLFCVIQLRVADASSAFFFREQSYLLRDAIVRIASRMPVPAGTEPKSFDRVAVTRIVMQAVSAIRPSARLTRVTVLEPAFMRN